MRPDERRREGERGEGGVSDGLLVGGLAFLLAISLLVWSATGLAGLFDQGSWPSQVTFGRTPLAMRHLIQQPHDIAGAWPNTPEVQLSGYGLFWGLFISQLLVLLVLTVFVMGAVVRWRAGRARRAARRKAAAFDSGGRPEGTAGSVGRPGRAAGSGVATEAASGSGSPGAGAGLPPGDAAGSGLSPTGGPGLRPADAPGAGYAPGETSGSALPSAGAGSGFPPEVGSDPAASSVAASVAASSGASSHVGAPHAGTPHAASSPNRPLAATPPAANSGTAGHLRAGASGPTTTPLPPAAKRPVERASYTAGSKRMGGWETMRAEGAATAPAPVHTLRGPLVLGPPETRHPLAGEAVRDAEGPALVITSNPALWSETKDARAKLGPVLLYDPSHLCDTPARLHWSPSAGCANKDIAKARAAALLAPVRPTAKIDQMVADVAETLLRSYLHAAAADGRTIRHLHRWAQGAQVQEVVRILRANPKAASGAAGELESALTSYPERRDVAQELTARALSALFTVNVRESCTPNRTDALALDSFVNEGGTLYVVGDPIEDPKANPGAMPLLTALASSVVERGRRMAERSSSGRLDPPLTLVLDDVAAVAPLPQLPDLLTTGVDRGMPTLALLRSREQARTRWPHQELPA